MSRYTVRTDTSRVSASCCAVSFPRLCSSNKMDTSRLARMPGPYRPSLTEGVSDPVLTSAYDLQREVLAHRGHSHRRRTPGQAVSHQHRAGYRGRHPEGRL